MFSALDTPKGWAGQMGGCRKPGLGTQRVKQLWQIQPGGLDLQGSRDWALPCGGHECVGTWPDPSPGAHPTLHPPWPLPEPEVTPVPFKEQMNVPQSCGLQSPAHLSLCAPLLLVLREAGG